MSWSPDPNKVIPGVIAGTLNALSAAAKQPSIKRFIYTSSSTAITQPKPNLEFTISTDNWNEEAIADAWAPPPYTTDRSFIVYGASKTQAEQEVWKYVAEKKPTFTVNSVLPNLNLGPILSDKFSASTGGAIKYICEKGEIGDMEPPQWMVNVQDTARLHVAALIDPDISGQRILAFAYPFNFNDVLACLRRLYPDKTFPGDIEGLGRDLSKLDNSQGADILRRFGRDGWTGLEESVRENVDG